EGVEIVVLHRASIFTGSVTLTENTSYLWVPPSVVQSVKKQERELCWEDCNCT
ncbi:hypothetical protein CFC21_020909, partial [Triticum aestivum]